MAKQAADQSSLWSTHQPPTIHHHGSEKVSIITSSRLESITYYIKCESEAINLQLADYYSFQCLTQSNQFAYRFAQIVRSQCNKYYCSEQRCFVFFFFTTADAKVLQWMAGVKGFPLAKVHTIWRWIVWRWIASQECAARCKYFCCFSGWRTCNGHR